MSPSVTPSRDFPQSSPTKQPSQLVTNNVAESPNKAPMLIDTSEQNSSQVYDPSMYKKIKESKLPQYKQLQHVDFCWGSLSGEDFRQKLEVAYSEVVHWKRNLFQIPRGEVGGKFVSELARLFQGYAYASNLESIALKAAMTMPHLLLQKVDRKSCWKKTSECLARRLSSWKEGDIDNLLFESRTIQQRLQSKKAPNRTMICDLSRQFANYMNYGNTKAAQRILSGENNCGLLLLDECIDDGTHRSVREVLKDKHPAPSPLFEDAVLPAEDQSPNVHPIVFEKIDGTLIREMALKCTGTAGPSGLDASDWRHLCTGFHSHSSDLCNSLASVAQRIATEFLDPSGISALAACRLVPLDKNLVLGQ